MSYLCSTFILPSFYLLHAHVVDSKMASIIETLWAYIQLRQARARAIWLPRVHKNRWFLYDTMLRAHVVLPWASPVLVVLSGFWHELICSNRGPRKRTKWQDNPETHGTHWRINRTRNEARNFWAAWSASNVVSSGSLDGTNIRNRRRVAIYVARITGKDCT